MIARILSLCCVVVVSAAGVASADDRTEKAEPGKSSVTRDSANRIEATLQQTTECSFTDVPLEEALHYFSELHHINIWMDKQALQDEGINSDTQITLIMSGITLETAVRLILSPLALTHVIEDGVLKITTKAKADEIMSTRVYPVADLAMAGAQAANFGPLMNAITQATSGKWSLQDGDGGAIVPVASTQSLVIRQTQKVHREIERLLVALRKARQTPHVTSIPADLGDSDVLNHLPVQQSCPVSAVTPECWRRPRHRARR